MVACRRGRDRSRGPQYGSDDVRSAGGAVASTDGDRGCERTARDVWRARGARAPAGQRAGGARRGPGDRVALLSENRAEFLELFLAAARLGAIVACQNWRLAPPELAHCLRLVEPAVAVVSPRARCTRSRAPEPQLVLGRRRTNARWRRRADDASAERRSRGRRCSSSTPAAPPGCPRAPCSATAPRSCATWSCAPSSASRPTTRSSRGRRSITWARVDYSLGTLMSGGKVIVVDGFDRRAPGRRSSRSEPLGWLLLMPGMVGRFADVLAARGHHRPRGEGLRRDGRPGAARGDRRDHRAAAARPTPTPSAPPRPAARPARPA